MFFNRLINKKLQRKGETLIQESSMLMAKAVLLLEEMVESLVTGDHDRLVELSSRITEIERNADDIKDKLIQEIFTKRAYLKQGIQDRHELVIRIDKILSRIEHAARLMEALYVSVDAQQKQLFRTLASYIKETVTNLEEAIKSLWIDYKQSQELTRRVEESREKARDAFYDLLKAIKSSRDTSSSAFLMPMAEALVQIAVSAEVGADHVRAIIIRSF